MGKTFKDLSVGDSVWIIDGLEITEAEVKRITNGYGILIHTSYKPYPFRSPYYGAKRTGDMFLEYKEALEYLQKRSKKRMRVLEKKIDILASEILCLDSIQPPTVVFSSTKPLSMKELKPGDSVWWVDKFKKDVKRVEVKAKRENKDIWSNGSLIIDTKTISFKTFLNSLHSVSLDCYTEEKQAWKYMLRWKESRIETVGKEMENLMKELENLEKHEEIWGLEERGLCF